MTGNTQTEREQGAQALLDDTSNDWGGSASVEEIAAARFAVVVERENDSWVLAAESWCVVAEIHLATMVGTEGYDEWVDAVVDMETGEPVEGLRCATSVELFTGDGLVGRATSGV